MRRWPRTGSTSAMVAMAALGALVIAGCASNAPATSTGSTLPGVTSSAGMTVSAATRPSTPAGTPTSQTAAGDTQPSTPASPPTPSASASASSTASAGSSGSSGETACTTAHLTIALGRPNGAAGSVIYPLEFTNTGSDPCTLQGFPGVSYVAGDDGHQVGGAAAWAGDDGPAVTLKPGATATALLQEVNVQNFPKDVCDPVPVRGLRVYPPGETHAAYVPQAGATACAKTPLPDGQMQLSVRAVGTD